MVEESNLPDKTFAVVKNREWSSNPGSFEELKGCYFWVEIGRQKMIQYTRKET